MITVSEEEKCGYIGTVVADRGIDQMIVRDSEGGPPGAQVTLTVSFQQLFFILLVCRRILIN